MKTVVKRRGHSETFDERKLYASIYHACLAVHVPISEAELVAKRVTADIVGWIDNKHQVTSGDIFRLAGKHFIVYNPDAAYIYKKLRRVS